MKKGTYASTNVGNTVVIFSQATTTDTLTSMEAMHWCQVIVGYCIDGEVQCESFSTTLSIYQLAAADAADAALNSTGDISEAPLRGRAQGPAQKRVIREPFTMSTAL